MPPAFPTWRRRLAWAVPIAIGILPAILSSAVHAANPAMQLVRKNPRTLPRRALADLSSDRYVVRQRASAAIRKALAGQFGAIIEAVEPEKKNRLIKLLQFDAQISRWAQAVLARPPQKRAAMFAWGLQGRILPLTAEAFSSRSSRRAAAARGLAKIPGPQAEWVLQRLLASSHRLVYLTAMAAVWNRKPSPAMVRIVWRHVIATGYPLPPAATNWRGVLFHGQRIIVPKIVNFWQQIQDSGYARQLLAHWKPPELAELLVGFARDAARANGANNPGANLFSNPGMMQVTNYIRLFRLYKPPAAAPYLLRLLMAPPVNNINFNFNNTPAHWDNHTTPLYLLILAAGRAPAKYHFYRSNLYGGRWLLHTPAEENRDIKKIIAWFQARGVRAWTSSAGTRPATRPEAVPPPPPLRPPLPVRVFLHR